MGVFGAPDVNKLAAKRDVKGLNKALAYKKDADVRRDAAFRLEKIRDPRAVEPLIGALADKQWEVRMYAADALGEIGDPRAVEPLIGALNHDAEVRGHAAHALGKIGDAAVEPLLDALADNSWSREAAADALGSIGDPRAVEPLIGALTDTREEVSEAAARALGEIQRRGGW